MVGRGGGRKIGTKIAPGRLQSCVQATRNMLLNKQNASGINKNTNLFITDETMRLVSQNLERQRRTHTCNNIIPNESPPVNDHVPHHVPDSENEVQNTHVENEPNNSYEDDQESQGLIRPMNEGTGVRSYAKQKAQLEQQRIVNEQQEKIQQQEEQIKELQKTVEAIRTQQEATKESLKQSILQELLNLGGR